MLRRCLISRGLHQHTEGVECFIGRHSKRTKRDCAHAACARGAHELTMHSSLLGACVSAGLSSAGAIAAATVSTRLFTSVFLVVITPQAGNTALMWAATCGLTTIAKMLIHEGAAVDRRNRSGQTALMLAAECDCDPIVHAILAVAMRNLLHVQDHVCGSHALWEPVLARHNSSWHHRTVCCGVPLVLLSSGGVISSALRCPKWCEEAMRKDGE